MYSIIIPVFNQHEMTKECLDAIYNCSVLDHEIVVIDNGSDPPIDRSLADVLIRCDNNRGFPAAINLGIVGATGDTVILLNNDVVVTPGWDAELLKHLDNYDIVGPVTNYAAGLQRELVPTYHDLDALNTVATSWGEAHRGETIEVNWLIGFCMAFRRKLWEELGPLDETNWPCSGEELDFCLSARKTGHRVGIAMDVYVHHHGSQTFQDLQGAGVLDYPTICKRDSAHVIKKHGEFWTRQRVERTAA